MLIAFVVVLGVSACGSGSKTASQTSEPPPSTVNATQGPATTTETTTAITTQTTTAMTIEPAIASAIEPTVAITTQASATADSGLAGHVPFNPDGASDPADDARALAAVAGFQFTSVGDPQNLTVDEARTVFAELVTLTCTFTNREFTSSRSLFDVDSYVRRSGHDEFRIDGNVLSRVTHAFFRTYGTYDSSTDLSTMKSGICDSDARSLVSAIPGDALGP